MDLQGFPESPDGLRRGDKDPAWLPSQEVTDLENVDSSIDKDQLFLVSLGALMSLFT